jgi:transposase
MNEFSLFVGIDWGSEEHTVRALDPTGHLQLQRTIKHTASDLAALADALLAVCPDPATVAIAIEVPRGAVVETLIERGFAVFACNPKQLDRFRDRHCTSGAKDDSRDAFVLADAARTDLHKLRPLTLDDPLTIQLREMSRLEVELDTECRRHTNRLRDQLLRYFPQLLRLSPAADEPWLWDLLGRAPTPERASRLRQKTVEQLLRRYRIRRFSAQELMALLREEPPFVAPGVVEAASAHVFALLPILWPLHAQVQQTERRIEQLLEQVEQESECESEGEGQHRDVTILRSMAGVGRVVAATMLAEAPQALSERDLQTLRALMGVAPVTKRSGKSIHHVMRRACNPRLRQAAYYWAAGAMAFYPEWKTRYAELRARGHKHGRALRGVADALLRVLMAMLRDGTCYDASKVRRAPAAP